MSTMRMPPLVLRRITQYAQPREQPRSASIRNMFDELGVRRADRRPGRQLVVRRPWPAPAARRRGSRARSSSGSSRASAAQRVVLARARGQHVERLVHGLVGLAHQDRVGERRERQRVADGERPAAQHERRALVALLGERRDARQLERVDHAGELELVRDRERDHRIAARPAGPTRRCTAARRSRAAPRRRRAGTRARRRGRGCALISR